MALIYITGVAGSGKTTLKEYLVAQGKSALDIDFDGLSGWKHVATNRCIYEDELPEAYPDDWHLHYEWHLSPSKIAMLAEQAQHQDIYLCGASGNDEEVHHLLDQVYFLCVDEQTIRHRLANRTNSDYGKKDTELNHILNVYQPAEQYYRNYGATMLDATLPIDILAQSILSPQAEAIPA